MNIRKTKVPKANKLVNENLKSYHDLYQRALDFPDEFWAEQAQHYISWFSPWTHVLKGNFANVNMQWFVNGTLNACYNCVDRHLEKRKNQIALLWEGNNPNESSSLTYQQLYEQVCKFSNVLKDLGIQKGDRVCIYLPMIPEAIIAMLACARIGAIHSIVFAGFSAESLKSRILDSKCKLLITADESIRGEKKTSLKQNSDQALYNVSCIEHVIVVKNTKCQVEWHKGRDIWYHEAMLGASLECPVEHMRATDPFFILYTSGSTGQPKGVLHSTGGYLVYVAMTFKTVFNYTDGDVHWCSADIGWITGHSYLVYGPLLNGATTLLFDGIPSYPTFSRYWEIIDKYNVNQFYTSPTAIRALRREGDAWVKTSSRKSLKILGTAGEPINPSVWEWFNKVVGEERCPIVNTWWQTETGGIMLSPSPNITNNIPGSVGIPIFGIIPDIVDEKGNSIKDDKPGKMVIKKPWPGLMQTIYGDHQRFIDTYFKEVPGCYLTGDDAYQDQSENYWVRGRYDDVLKISGHRIGTAELESAFVSHHAVAEAAVVGVPDEIKGESIYAYITLCSNVNPSNDLKKELIEYVRNKIGPIATPKTIQWAQALPKTRSGKIMRRILSKIANNEHDNLGDISTLSDPSVVDRIIKDKK